MFCKFYRFLLPIGKIEYCTELCSILDEQVYWFNSVKKEVEEEEKADAP